MTECNKRLTTLVGRLQRSLGGRQGIDIRLLPETQMQISRNLIPNPDFGTGGKTYSNIPDKDGYRIYVACHTQVEYAAVTGTSQRLLGQEIDPVAWNTKTNNLQMEPGSASSRWAFLNSEEQVISVTAQCGSSQVVNDVNAILAEIARVMMS